MAEHYLARAKLREIARLLRFLMSRAMRSARTTGLRIFVSWPFVRVSARAPTLETCDRATRSTEILAAVAACAAIVSLLVALYLAHAIVVPIRTLTSVVHAMGTAISIGA